MAKCHYQAEENEEILYEDFTSLYPTINKYGIYPIGHPQIIVNPTDYCITYAKEYPATERSKETSQGSRIRLGVTGKSLTAIRNGRLSAHRRELLRRTPERCL